MKKALFIRLFVSATLAASIHATPVLAQADAMAHGEVRKIDKAAKKITLKHGPITNLDMPGMTMVFHVKDPAMLDQVRQGDKVKFSAEKVGEFMTVIKMVPEK